MTLGPAPIFDLDGTLTSLPLDWGALRERLGVSSLLSLWRGADASSWEVVTAAEVRAAQDAECSSWVEAAVRKVESFTVLTDNSETAALAFIRRFSVLAERVRLVVGRESLGGPKTDFSVFERGFKACASVAGLATPTLVYVGDSDFELSFASQLGARVVDARLIGGP